MMIRAQYDQIDSTNLRARALARTNPGRVLLVHARRQTAGRGRLGRSWESPLGGAWFSLAWPCRRGVDRYGQASLVAGQIMHAVLCERYGLDAPDLRIKWPNDLLLRDRKICGILCEWQADTTAGAGTLIVGVGVNVAVNIAQLPAELRERAGSIRAARRDEAECNADEVDIRELVDAAGGRLADALARFEDAGFDRFTRDAVLLHLAWRGQAVHVRVGGRQWAARIVGLDEEGRLEVTGENPQTIERLDSGEIVRLDSRESAPLSAGKQTSEASEPVVALRAAQASIRTGQIGASQ